MWWTAVDEAALSYPRRGGGRKKSELSHGQSAAQVVAVVAALQTRVAYNAQASALTAFFMFADLLRIRAVLGWPTPPRARGDQEPNARLLCR